MNMQMKRSNLVACTCWHCSAMLTDSSVTLRLHKSNTEVKLNSNVVYIKQMLPLFFVYLLFNRACRWNLSSSFVQLADICVLHTEMYSETFGGLWCFFFKEGCGGGEWLTCAALWKRHWNTNVLVIFIHRQNMYRSGRGWWWCVLITSYLGSKSKYSSSLESRAVAMRVWCDNGGGWGWGGAERILQH